MKTRRHAKILELIREHDIETQDELIQYLREAGFDVTQATVSRDIKELRLIKTLSGSGRYKYSTGSDGGMDMSSKFHSLFTDSAISVDSAMNILVIKCMVGMAQALCTGRILWVPWLVTILYLWSAVQRPLPERPRTSCGSCS